MEKPLVDRRVVLLSTAFAVALVSFGIALVLIRPQIPGGISLGGLLVADTVTLMVALVIVFVVAASRASSDLRLIPNRLQNAVEAGVGFLKNVVFAVITPTAARPRPIGLIAIGALVIAIFGCGIVPFLLLPAAHLSIALPVISVPGEHYPGSAITNTLVGTFIADIIVLVFAFAATRNLKEVPGRLQSVFEMIVEFFDNTAKQMARPVARQLLPLALTVFLFILAANWLELIPGVDSIGFMECAKAGQNGYPNSGAVLDVRRPLDSGKAATAEDREVCDRVAAGNTLTAAEQSRADITAVMDAHPGEEVRKYLTMPAQLAIVNQPSFSSFQPLRPNLHVITSFVRAAATDLNLTLMLAIMAFFVIQYYGIRANGGAYFYKFVNVPAMRTVINGKTPGKKVFGVIDVIVGLLETISELAKILSFGFRLFGNIFAGQALLFVMTFLIATLLPVVFYGLELFVGLIQAYVFAMLILMFTGMAIASHHTPDEEEHHGQDPAVEAGPVANL